MGDFRAELAALVAAYDEHGGQWSESDVDELWHAAERARAALAQPEAASAVEAAIAAGQPVTLPSGTVIADPAWFESRIAIRAADLLERQAAAAPVARLPEDAQVIEPANRTILVPVPAPIPVSERLPGPDDCDAEGNCWWFSFEELAWIFADLEYAKNRRHTYWLPAHALPLPEVE